MSEAVDPLAIPLLEGAPEPIAALRERGIPPSNLYRALANQPALLAAWTDFAWQLRDECETPRALRELIVLRAAQLAGARYIWRDHVPMALAAGVDQERIEALPGWRQSPLFEPAERAVLAFAEELLGEGAVGEDTLAELARHFPAPARIELALTAGFYAMVPRVLNALRVPLEPLDGSPPEPLVPFPPPTEGGG